MTYKEFNIKSSGSKVFIMVVVALGCLIVAAAMIGGLYFFLIYEKDRLDGASVGDTQMPVLDKDGMNYFVSRQKQRVIPDTPAPSSSVPAASSVPKNQP